MKKIIKCNSEKQKNISSKRNIILIDEIFGYTKCFDGCEFMTVQRCHDGMDGILISQHI